jgi:hypothetical protein
LVFKDESTLTKSFIFGTFNLFPSIIVCFFSASNLQPSDPQRPPPSKALISHMKAGRPSECSGGKLQPHTYSGLHASTSNVINNDWCNSVRFGPRKAMLRYCMAACQGGFVRARQGYRLRAQGEVRILPTLTTRPVRARIVLDENEGLK